MRGDGGNLKPAIDFFGTQTAIAEKFDIKKSRVNHWTKRGVPAFWAAKIEDVTNGAVTLKMLIPDLNKPSTKCA
jgi:DNA-binding transcriptional regulator YdaS (Cro superfamily)